jgi:hypothetical protein
MSRSWRSPRTKTQVHRDIRNKFLDKLYAKEAFEELRNKYPQEETEEQEEQGEDVEKPLW